MLRVASAVQHFDRPVGACFAAWKEVAGMGDWKGMSFLRRFQKYYYQMFFHSLTHITKNEKYDVATSGTLKVKMQK